MDAPFPERLLFPIAALLNRRRRWTSVLDWWEEL